MPALGWALWVLGGWDRLSLLLPSPENSNGSSQTEELGAPCQCEQSSVCLWGEECARGVVCMQVSTSACVAWCVCVSHKHKPRSSPPRPPPDPIFSLPTAGPRPPLSADPGAQGYRPPSRQTPLALDTDLSTRSPEL